MMMKMIIMITDYLMMMIMVNDDNDDDDDRFCEYDNTAGPQSSSHQLSGYLYYLATILHCIMSVFHSFPHLKSCFKKNKN